MVVVVLLGYALIIGYVGVICWMFVVALTLHEQTSPQLRHWWVMGSIGSILFGVAMLMVYANDNNIDPVMSGFTFCLLPILTLCFWVALMSEQRHLEFMPDRVKRMGFTFLVGMGLIWSPVMVPKGGQEICNVIHQWQLAPVVTGLQQYRRDRGQYPFGLQALLPYYIKESPGLLCFWGIPPAIT